MPQKREKLIAVVGGREPSLEEARLAEEVGRELARRGAILICGGLSGVMEAACRGATSEGGLTIGILPGNSSDDANPHVRIPIVTAAGHARNMAVVKSARAVIAIGGGYGTLTEIAYARESDIPVIGLNTWSISRNDQTDDSIIVTEDPARAVDIAISSE
ncbi:MAG: TIGR00725 family protein [Dehalococcoidales bacterium]|nr:MAG: TIGR00725 family protein [Dehalococcoidales bacterium]